MPVIHYHHLLLTKIATGRAKDKADIEELERINKYKKKVDGFESLKNFSDEIQSTLISRLMRCKRIKFPKIFESKSQPKAAIVGQRPHGSSS